MKVKSPVALFRDPVNPLEPGTKQYVDPRLIPAGGTLGQSLVKTGGADYATGWATIGGSSGAHSHVQSDVADLPSDLRAVAARQVYVRDPAGPLAPLRSALASRNSFPVDMVFIGDSITEGAGATTKAKRYIELVRDAMRAAYPTTGVAGGVGYVPAMNISTTFGHGWGYEGNIGGNGTFGLGHRSAELKPPDGGISRVVYGTSVTIFFTTSSALGSFQVFLDGVSQGTVSSASGTSTARDNGRYTLNFARGTHTVRLVWTAGGTGGSSFINGFMIYDQDETKGVRLWESGQHGSSSADWSTLTSTTAYVLSDDLATIQPDLVFISLGPNDMIQGLTPASYKTNITTLISQVRAACTVPPTIVLMAAYQLAATYAYPWQDYVDRLREITAADTGTTLLDLSSSLPTAARTSYGLISGDGVHPNDTGYDVIARRVTDLLIDHLTRTGAAAVGHTHDYGPQTVNYFQPVATETFTPTAGASYVCGLAETSSAALLVFLNGQQLLPAEYVATTTQVTVTPVEGPLVTTDRITVVYARTAVFAGTYSSDIAITDATKGVLLKDRTNGNRYRLFMSGGVLGTELVA